MSEYIQVECPDGRSREIVGIERALSGEREVIWCSRTLDRPDCNSECLKETENVAYIMLCGLPKFEHLELDTLSGDDILERFTGLPLERLPVVNEGKLVGSITLRNAARWKEAKAAAQGTASLWDRHPKREVPAITTYVEVESDVLQLDDPWLTAVQNLLRTHRNEAFVVDHEGFVVGAVYARQLLRQSVSRLGL